MKKKTNPLRDKPTGELFEMLADLQNQYFRRRFTSDPKRIPNPSKFKGIRRQVARIKTILKEREAENKTEA